MHIEANNALCNSSFNTAEPRLRTVDSYSYSSSYVAKNPKCNSIFVQKQNIHEVGVGFLDFLGLLNHNTMDRNGISADEILSAANADD